jgi:hypothetical protein
MLNSGFEAEGGAEAVLWNPLWDTLHITSSSPHVFKGSVTYLIISASKQSSNARDHCDRIMQSSGSAQSRLFPSQAGLH